MRCCSYGNGILWFSNISSFTQFFCSLIKTRCNERQIFTYENHFPLILVADMYYEEILLFIQLMNSYTLPISTEELKSAFTINSPPTKLSVLQKFLTANKASSRLECLHRCKQHPGCEEVGVVDGGECWLLGEEASNVNSIENNREEIKELLTPHKLPVQGSKIYFICVVCVTGLFWEWEDCRRGGGGQNDPPKFPSMRLTSWNMCKN